MPKAKESPNLGGLVPPHRLLPYGMRQFMVQDECGAEVARPPARPSSASRYPGKNRLAGKMARPTNEIWQASERASKRPSFLSPSLSRSAETTFPLSLSLSSAAEREGAILFPRDSWRIRGRPNHETSLDSRTTYGHPGDLLSLRCLVRMRQARSFKSSKFPKEAGHCLFEVSFSRTEMGLSIATRFCDCYRQVEEDVISNIRN